MESEKRFVAFKNPAPALHHRDPAVLFTSGRQRRTPSFPRRVTKKGNRLPVPRLKERSMEYKTQLQIPLPTETRGKNHAAAAIEPNAIPASPSLEEKRNAPLPTAVLTLTALCFKEKRIFRTCRACIKASTEWGNEQSACYIACFLKAELSYNFLFELSILF